MVNCFSVAKDPGGAAPAGGDALKSSTGYRIGIVNPLTLVGNEIKTILRDRSFPFAKVSLLDSTGKAAGALTEVDEEPAVVAAVSDDELEDLDLVFFCGPPSGNREWIDHYRDDRFVVIDVSQPSTIESGKLAVAGINLDAITGKDTLLISPHPVAIPIALILHQIQMLSAIELCTATVVQPASEFEQVGVEELAQQAISVLNVRSVTKEVFDRQLAFNLYPALERNEEFIVEQIRALTEPDAQFALLITQGTIFHLAFHEDAGRSERRSNRVATEGESGDRAPRGRPVIRHDRRRRQRRGARRRGAARSDDSGRILGVGRLR